MADFGGIAPNRLNPPGREADHYSMALQLPPRHNPNRVVPGLVAFALGTALIASALAQSAQPSTAPDIMNRTQEALAGFEDITPPGEARP